MTCRLPGPEDAARLRDHATGLASFPGFAELKWSMCERPQLHSFGAQPGTAGAEEDWNAGRRKASDKPSDYGAAATSAAPLPSSGSSPKTVSITFAPVRMAGTAEGELALLPDHVVLAVLPVSRYQAETRAQVEDRIRSQSYRSHREDVGIDPSLFQRDRVKCAP